MRTWIFPSRHERILIWTLMRYTRFFFFFFHLVISRSTQRDFSWSSRQNARDEEDDGGWTRWSKTGQGINNYDSELEQTNQEMTSVSLVSVSVNSENVHATESERSQRYKSEWDLKASAVNGTSQSEIWKRAQSTVQVRVRSESERSQRYKSEWDQQTEVDGSPILRVILVHPTSFSKSHVPHQGDPATVEDENVCVMSFRMFPQLLPFAQICGTSHAERCFPSTRMSSSRNVKSSMNSGPYIEDTYHSIWCAACSNFWRSSTGKDGFTNPCQKTYFTASDVSWLRCDTSILLPVADEGRKERFFSPRGHHSLDKFGFYIFQIKKIVRLCESCISAQVRDDSLQAFFQLAKTLTSRNGRVNVGGKVRVADNALALISPSDTVGVTVVQRLERIREHISAKVVPVFLSEVSHRIDAASHEEWLFLAASGDVLQSVLVMLNARWAACWNHGPQSARWVSLSSPRCRSSSNSWVSTRRFSMSSSSLRRQMRALRCCQIPHTRPCHPWVRQFGEASLSQSDQGLLAVLVSPTVSSASWRARLAGRGKGTIEEGSGHPRQGPTARRPATRWQAHPRRGPTAGDEWWRPVTSGGGPPTTRTLIPHGALLAKWVWNTMPTDHEMSYRGSNAVLSQTWSLISNSPKFGQETCTKPTENTATNKKRTAPMHIVSNCRLWTPLFQDAGRKWRKTSSGAIRRLWLALSRCGGHRETVLRYGKRNITLADIRVHSGGDTHPTTCSQSSLWGSLRAAGKRATSQERPCFIAHLRSCWSSFSRTAGSSFRAGWILLYCLPAALRTMSQVVNRSGSCEWNCVRQTGQQDPATYCRHGFLQPCFDIMWLRSASRLG